MLHLEFRGCMDEVFSALQGLFHFLYTNWVKMTYKCLKTLDSFRFSSQKFSHRGTGDTEDVPVADGTAMCLFVVGF